MYINIEKLRVLIGINCINAIKVFNKFYDTTFIPRGYNKEIGGFPEELVAIILNEKRPTSFKGPDFSEFEVKSVKSKITKRKGEIRGEGDMPISNWDNEKNFKNSNIWKKMKKMVIFYHIDNIIVDIRVFNGEKYFNILENDYELIREGKNKETTIITRKPNTNSIQVKKSFCIFNSYSLFYDDGCIPKVNGDVKSDDYILDLFIQYNKPIDAFEKIVNNEKSLDNLQKMKNIIEQKIKENNMFKMDNLPF